MPEKLSSRFTVQTGKPRPHDDSPKVNGRDSPSSVPSHPLLSGLYTMLFQPGFWGTGEPCPDGSSKGELEGSPGPLSHSRSVWCGLAESYPENHSK